MIDIQQTVRNCQDGHLDAFAILFSHYQNRIYDLACIIVRDETAAKDVVQDTFLALFEKIGSYKGDAAFETWLTSVAVNQSRMYLRKQRIRQRWFPSLEQLAPRFLRRLSKREQDMDDIVDRRQQRQSLWHMVDQLQDRLRLPLILRYRYGYGCQDIATILGKRTSTIYQQLHEGRRLLEQMAAQQGESTTPALAQWTD